MVLLPQETSQRQGCARYMAEPLTTMLHLSRHPACIRTAGWLWWRQIVSSEFHVGVPGVTQRQPDHIGSAAHHNWVPYPSRVVSAQSVQVADLVTRYAVHDSTQLVVRSW